MNFKKNFLLIFSFFILHFSISADVLLPKLISDGMVLQRDVKVNVWGWADANEKVTVTIDGKSVSTTTDENGKWKLQLKPHKAGGPYTMLIEGKNKIELKNILFGDVWLCSGQSNMELPVRRVLPLYTAEIKSAVNSNIRSFTVPQKYNFKYPESDFSSGNWREVNPQSVLNFSAVAYFFASEIYSKYKIPVGIINASLGGSPIQSWMSEEALEAFPQYLNEARKFRDDQLIKDIESADNKRSNEWYATSNQRDAGLSGNWKNPELNDSDWKTMTIPGYWNDFFSEIKNGVVWFRKEFTVSKNDAKKSANLNLGRIVDADSVFINERFVGNVTYQYPPRWYNVPENVLREGKNVIVVRVVSNAGKGGFVPDKPYEISIGATKIDLKGDWKMKQGCAMDALPGPTFIRWKPLGLYNSMIAPQLNFVLKGVLWYQGESNTGNPAEYAQLLPAMIADWRKNFQQKNLPFIYAQLPNFMESKSEPTESNWAAFRHAQASALSVKRTAMTVNIDLGEWNDIHPLNKKDIAMRMAIAARKMVYNDRIIVASGPIYKSSKLRENKVEISFSNIGSGLITKDGNAPKYFAIAAADKKFVWANAEIRKNKVIVWNESITNPVFVRYAWEDNPEKVNLYNREGLPAGTFEAEIKIK